MKRYRGPGGGLVLFLTAALALAARGAPAQTVQTIIGPSNEDGLPATRVMFHAPFALARDGTGVLYVLENGSYNLFGFPFGPSQVRVIAPDGTITRVVAPAWRVRRRRRRVRRGWSSALPST